MSEVRQFVQWVASNRAYNGGDDSGQEFYDRGFNSLLWVWAEEFLEREVAPGGRGEVEGLSEREARQSAVSDWNQRHPEMPWDRLAPSFRAALIGQVMSKETQ